MDEQRKEEKKLNQELEKKSNKKKIAIIIAAVFLFFILSLAVAGVAVFKYYYNLLDYQPRGVDEKWEVIVDEEEEPNDNYDVSVSTEGEPEDGMIAEDIPEEEIEALEKDIQKNIEEIKETVLMDTDTFNILLIGVDSRSDSNSGRSDAMILISINQEAKKIVMTSLLRDIYVSIPGHGSNRLNGAYAYGGPSLLADTIEKNFGIEVDNYMTVNFLLVMDIINQLGGLDIEVSSEEIKVMNSYIKEHNGLLGNSAGTDILNAENPGNLHLNGSQAVAYMRVRYVGTDFARTGRQRTIINRSLEKAKGMNLAEMNSMMGQFLPRVRTDLTEMDCANLLLMLLGISDYSIDSMTIPQEGTWKSARIRGMAVLSVDMKANAKAWYEKVSEK